ncbi:hypothetical protein CHS0354_029914 [Potamilus streckersoni]|uniref:Mitochondrial inner membrane protease ATP23 n=1 Tax=Potamilus streckersoni TaxID=2493646 RepID=A0AAE0RT02_9BIVA|nr:hypothetical protein CHS0354_029914 [Potamilus streckersoni]
MANPEPSSHGSDTKDDLLSSHKEKFQKSKDEYYGYDLYPEREGDTDMIKQGRDLQTVKCEKNVIWCAEKDPRIKLLMGALKSRGCPIDLGRHVSCEPCNFNVNGGYDPVKNQVVVCKNMSKTKNACCNVMAHELLHAFDACRAKVDFSDLQHLACTEIRAANLNHCYFLSAWETGIAYPWNFKEKHRECVKNKAILSVILVRNLPAVKAREIVDKVFDKCYQDLEPFGRRMKKGSRDAQRAYCDASLYGYTDS